tara:strand:+ start:5635 stop:6270 length:636 start_codon:yes stop_codon:yes gene_type:complete
VGAKKALERSQKNLADKLAAKGLKLPLYPTPQLIDRAREVMGSIDFDPTSDPVQQVLVDATSVPSIEVNPLQEHWHGNVWVAPKGAVRDSRIWLNKTLSEYRNGYIKSFVFFSSASELLRAAPVVWDYPICIPFKRVKQLRATATGFEPVSPSTWNLIIFGPPINQALTDIDKVSLFYNSFRDVGRVIYSEYAGDNWSKDLEFFEDNKGII